MFSRKSIILISLYICFFVNGIPQLQLDDRLIQFTEEFRSILDGPRNVIQTMCANSTLPSLDTIRELHYGRFENIDYGTKCFIHCIFSAVGLVKEGNLNIEAITNMMSKFSSPLLVERTRNVLQHCRDNSVGKDPCDVSLDLIKCSYNFDRQLHNYRPM